MKAMFGHPIRHLYHPIVDKVEAGVALSKSRWYGVDKFFIGGVRQLFRDRAMTVAAYDAAISWDFLVYRW